MATQAELLMGRLRDDKFREKLLKLCSETLSEAATFCNEDLDNVKNEQLFGDWQRSLEFAMRDVRERIPDVLEKRIESLSYPRIITSGELWDEFEVYLQNEHCWISDETYDAYLDYIDRRLLKLRTSEPFTLCEIVFPEDTQEHDNIMRGIMHGALLTQASIVGNVSEDELKSSADALFKHDEEAAPQILCRLGDFQVLFCGIVFKSTAWGLRKPCGDERKTGTIQVQLSAHSSELAMQALVSDLMPLAQAHFQSIKYLETGKYLGSAVDVENFKKYLPFGVKCLEMAVLNTSNKDTFQRRIANAVRLLAAADYQRSDPIGLSLCVTAIEALLGTNDTEITKTLADSVGSLLEPEVGLRRKAAAFVVDLYKKRSRVLHGDRLEGNSQLRNDARQLAASVLFSVWSYQDFCEKWDQGDPKPKPDKLFEALRDDFVKPGLPRGVLELPIHALWRGSSHGKK